MSTPLSRREFLSRFVLGAGALSATQILAACGQEQIQVPTPTPRTPPPASSSTPEVPTQQSAVQAPDTAPPPSAVPESKAALSVARGGAPEDLVRSAITALGGMGLFVQKGAFVIIKPNICSPRSFEYAATTNPWVVGTLVKMCFEAGAGKVQVMDYPFDGRSEETYVVSGIQEQVQINGGEMVIMPKFKFITTPITKGISLKSAGIYDDILNADVVINVPIAKNHGLARLTLGMKNMMGVVRERPSLHRNLGQNLADLMAHVRPTLTVIDAVRILTANGPTGGNLDDVKVLDTVIASADPIAADSYGASLFGFRPQDLDYIVAGEAAGLGISDLGQIKIEEIAVGA